MTIFLRQSTASQEVPLGYFLDSTDGNTEETALTIANTDIKIWKTGATTLANKNSGGGTHISNGIYYAVLDATDTDTIGPLRIFIHVTGALAVKVDCVVLDEAVYDVLFGTTALATLSNITSIASVTGAVGSVTGNVGGNVTGTIGGFTTAAKAEIQTEAEDALVAHRLDELLNADSDIDGAAPPTVGSVFHELMTKTAGSFTYDQSTDSLEAVRDNIGAAGAGLTDLGGMSTTMKAQIEAEVDDSIGSGTGAALTAVPWNAAWDAEVQSEVEDALQTTISDSIPADGTRPSVWSALLMITRFLWEKAVIGTTATIKKEDGSTTAFTATLDSATDPTSITRAT